jgi:flagellar protein FliS
MNAKSALNQYRQTDIQGGVISATPHQLIQMLLNGALEKVNTAKGFMSQGVVAGKGENISWAISIIDGLRVSLDKEQGGEIAENLHNLYEYMGHTLLEANIQNSIEKVDEVIALLNQIKSAWDAIAPVGKSEIASEAQNHAGQVSVGA